jgi:hypothetical protein
MGPAQSQSQDRSWLILLGLWLPLAAGMIFLQQETITSLAFIDNDDFMRLTQVRDWLKGQSWWDMHQYRLNPPEGVLMHWQRLLDVPIAGVILLLAPLLGNLGAEQASVALVPMLLLLATARCVQRTGILLAGPAAALPCALLCLSCVPILLQIFPGRIDHHAWQILCLAGMIYGLCDAKLKGYGVAGLFAGLAIAVGAEGVPFALVSCLLVTARLLFAPLPEIAQSRVFARVFALMFAGSVAGIFASTTPVALWGLSYCDTIARGPVIGALGFSATLILSTFLPSKRVMNLSVLLGFVATLALVLWLAPECRTSFGGLGDIDPMLKTLWLARVGEAQSVLADVATDPFEATLFLTMPLMAFGLLGYKLWSMHKATLGHVGTQASLWSALWPWLVLAAQMLMALAMALYMVRSAALLNTVAALVCGLGVAQIRSASASNPARLVAAWIGLSGLTPLVLASLASQVLGEADQVLKTAEAELKKQVSLCRQPAAFAELKKLPKSRILAPIESGAPILGFTAHRVLAAPYHRNNAGNGFTYRVLLGPAQAAPAMLRARGVHYITFCAASTEVNFLAEQTVQTGSVPKSLIQALVAKKPPEGISLLSTKGPLWLYKVEQN